MSKKILDNMKIISFWILIILGLFFIYLLGAMDNDKEIATQNKITKLEKRVDNLQQAMQTKDKELEAGLRNNYTGLMLKVDYLDKQIGESK